MTSQEEQMLHSLIERVNAAKLTEKDADAEALLQRGFSSNPDAFYILAQSVLVQNIALERAHAQLTESQNRVVELQQKLEQSQQQAAHSGGFLGNLLGHRDPAPQPAPPPPPAAQPAYQPVYTPQAAPQAAQGYQAPYNPAPQYAGPQFASPPQGPSFLGTAVATAAGIAAGALLFEGVEDILYGGYRRPGFGYGYGYPGYGAGLGGWSMPGVGIGFGPEVIVEQPIFEQPIVERPVQETIVENNYYDSGGDRSSQGANWNDDSGSSYDSSSDSGGGFDDSGSFADSGSGGDSGGF